MSSTNTINAIEVKVIIETKDHDTAKKLEESLQQFTYTASSKNLISTTPQSGIIKDCHSFEFIIILREACIPTLKKHILQIFDITIKHSAVSTQVEYST